MELRALRYFVTVADELHFGRAAERLHIAQPAVSQQIARLERELGVRLFDRSARKVELTAAGRRVLDAARATLAAADHVRIVAAASAGVLRIGTTAGLTHRLERGIDILREHTAHLEVTLVDLPLPARLAALRRGELDLALARGDIAAPGLTVLPTWHEPLLAVVSTRHPAATRQRITLTDLATDALRLPAVEHDRPLHDAVLAAFTGTGIHPRLGRPADSARDTLVEVGSDPATWTVLPADQVAEIGATRIRALPVDPPLTITGSVVVPDLPPGHSASCAAPAFRDSAPGH